MLPNALRSLALLAVTSSALAQGVIVPGAERLPAEAAVERGIVLLGELGCASCHDAGRAQAHLLRRAAPDLSRVGARVTPQYLRAFVRDPHRTKPGTPMPSLLHGRTAADDEAELLVHYLVSRGGPIAPARTGGSDALVARGKDLFASIGCVACHAPEDGRATEVGNIPLGQLAKKTTVDELERFLLDPHEARPAGRMPSLWLEPDEARALAVYLLREQLDNPQSIAAAPATRPGLGYGYYEFDDVSRLPDFTGLEPIAKGVAPEPALGVEGQRRNEQFALRFVGEIEIPRAGEHTFWTRSDDGSRLWVDGALIVDNDGEHATQEKSGKVELTAGPHAFEVAFFERRGGEALRVLWAGPGFEKTRIQPDVFTTSGGRPMVPLETADFVVDPDRARRGAELFASLGCAACHEDARSEPRPRPLIGLDPGAARGCLGDDPGAGAARYDLSRAQVAALRAALANPSWASRPPGDDVRVRRAFAAMNCYGCHVRGGIGGPEEARYDHFRTKITIDLGDEGRFPPPLDGVGSKLRADALTELLVDGAHHIRGDFMATRMPGFSKDAMRRLAGWLVAADGQRGDADAPAFTEEAVAVGHRLVGIRGFACITCHNVNGNRALAIPGVDLTTSYARLNPGWFARYVRDPGRYRPNTRMPAYWPGETSPFADLAGGSSRRQIEAVWSYLSLESSVPAPDGIVVARGDAEMELVPALEPIVHRTFMKGVGPRAIVAGFPVNTHVAFDANVVRLAKAWRGRFFDQSGVASGRTDRFLGPLGIDVLDMPPGPAFARLATADAPWPTAAKTDRNIGGRFRGYRLDGQRRPIFRYELDGVVIDEQPRPEPRPGGSVLWREFHLTAAAPPAGLAFLAWAGRKIEQLDDSTWRIDRTVTVRLRSDRPLAARVRESAGREELVVSIEFDEGAAAFEESVQW